MTIRGFVINRFAASGVRTGAGSDFAVIVGNSTSNSEVTTELLRLRRAPTRVFGFGPTSGGFGSIAAFDSLGAGFGGQHQAFDGAFARAGETVTHTALRAGIGTVPDVEALVRRGDVLTQRDAALEAALSWVRTELER